jgi:toxin ParE1/3/4
MSRYFFSIQAKQDLQQLVDRIARDNPTAAKRLAAEIKRKAKATAEFPAMGHSYAHLLPSLRGFFVGDYVILYLPKPNSIQVIRVLSGYRDLEAIFLEEDA